MRGRYLAQRTENFLLNYNHPLAQCLVFAGLGALPGSTRYQDSSPYGNHGTLTNMEPATDWMISNELQRRYLSRTGSSKHVVGGTFPTFTLPISISMWCYITSSTATRGSFWTHTPVNTNIYSGVWLLLTGSEAAYLSFGSGTGGIAAGSRRSGFSANGTVPENRWNHICGIITGATEMGIWINGVPMSMTYSGSGGALALLTDNPYSIGKSHDGVSVTYEYGSTCDPLFYNRALSTPEIALLADPSNVMLSGLIQPPKRRFFNIIRQIGTPYRRQSLILGTGNRFLNLGV